MSKKIRLEIPIEPKCVFFKFVEGKIELFSDVLLTKKLPIQGRTIYIDLQIPDDISVIQVINPTEIFQTPITSIYRNLTLLHPHNICFKNFSVIFDDRTIDIPIVDGKILPDRFMEKCKALNFKSWALAVYECYDGKSGDLYWSFKID